MLFNIEIKQIDINKEFSLDKQGVILLLREYNYRGIRTGNEIFGEKNLTASLTILDELNQANYISLVKKKIDDKLILEINSPQVSTESSNVEIDLRILKTFKINEVQYLTIRDQSSSESDFIYNLVKISFNNYSFVDLQSIEISSENDLINYLLKFNPIDILKINGIKITENHFKGMLNVFKNYDFDLELINLAVDYAISTSINHILSFKYLDMMLDTWVKKGISDIDSGLNFIQERKAAIANNGNKFVNPEYNQPTEVFTEKNIASLLMEDYDQ